MDALPFQPNDLWVVDYTLKDFVEHPERLEYARSRFSRSPPLYRSSTPTRPPSADPLTEEEQRREVRRFQLAIEYEASTTYHQFSSQNAEEQERVRKAKHDDESCRVPPNTSFEQFVSEKVKKRWVEQGIWNNKWGSTAIGRWKHEEPLELESYSETDSEAEPDASIFPSVMKRAGQKARRLKGDEERQRIMERRVLREREREASRPFHQFVYQVSKDRERILGKVGIKESTVSDSADVNTTAYENVKSIWIKRGIWYKKWGILPGMSWKHEQPFKEMCEDDLLIIPPTPCRSEVWFGTASPVEWNLGPASGVLNFSLQEQPGAIKPAGSQDSHVNHFHSAPNPRESLESRQDFGSAEGEWPPKGGRAPSHKDEQARPVTPASLGPIRPSRVSKAPRKKKPGPPRLPKPSGKSPVPSDVQPPLPGLHTPEPPIQTSPAPPRRSKRLQGAKASVAADPARSASTDLPNHASRPPPKGITGSPKTAATAESLGAHRVSKRQRPKAGLGRPRRDE